MHTYLVSPFFLTALVSRLNPDDDDDDDVYLIEKLQHVGYKIYLLTDQPIRHKYKMNSNQQ
jgi:hypothetical protein